jgi:hypothetical protein
MIQRVQSIYLVLALVGVILLFMFPTATFQITNSQTNVVEAQASLDLIKKATVYDELTGCIPTFIGMSSTLLLVIALVVGLGTLVSIFLFKKRVLQMRVVAFMFILSLAYVAIVFVSTVDDCVEQLEAMKLGNVAMSYNVGTFAPLAIAVLLFLAQQAIKKDELRVRAADRLR